MEYSPRCEIPYLSRVDARHASSCCDSSASTSCRRAISCSSSRRSGRTPPFVTHRHASEALYADQGSGVRRDYAPRSPTAGPTTEYEIQQLMVGWFRDHRLESDSPPVVAAGPNAGNPHYLPTASTASADRRAIKSCCWIFGANSSSRARCMRTSPGWASPARDVPDEVRRAFGAIRDAREAAITLVELAAAERRDLRGWQVDRAARDVLEAAGYGAQILHRTGHSLGEEVHGNGVHMDDYETHDDRRLLPGTGFTIEPGLYFDTFGVRTEINMVYGDGEALVTGPRRPRSCDCSDLRSWVQPRAPAMASRVHCRADVKPP